MKRTMIKKAMTLVTITFFCMLFVMSFTSQSYAKAKVLKLGHVNSPTSVWGTACTLFKNSVEKKTNGSVKVEVYPGGQIGGTTELVQAMTLGTVACYPETDLIFGSLAPYYKLWAVYYLFDSTEALAKFKDGPLQKKFEKQLLSRGIRQLGYFDSNFKFTMLSRKPLHKLEDFTGLKNRCPQIEAMIRSWKAIGSHPVGIDWGEVYTSLSTNLIEAVDNPIADMWHEKFNEVTDYHCITNGLQTFISWNFSDKIWQTLSPSEQKAILETVDEIRVPIKEWSDKDVKKALADIEKKGIKTIQTDKEALSKRIEEKIDYILSGDQELIDMYRQIRKDQAK